MRPRASPVTPRRSSNDVDDMRSEIHELSRRLRLSETQASHMAQRASQSTTAVRNQEEEMKASYLQWGARANEEVISLLNSFQMSATSDRQREQQVYHLESQLRDVEQAAVETRGRHEE
eukprot:4757939-Lingulodinium_polyedra.AAC.1